jgi:predicted DNA binding CopG/RHH family protein
MKKLTLDKEERGIETRYKRGEYESITDKKMLDKYREYAKATLARNKNINIRISEMTLHKLRTKAAEKGLPYQTLVASILHQYNG